MSGSLKPSSHSPRPWVSSWEKTSRIGGMIVGCAAGISLGMDIAFNALQASPSYLNIVITVGMGMIIGVLVGYAAGPICTVRLSDQITAQLIKKPLSEVLGGTIGAGAGILSTVVLAGLSSLFVGNFAWIVLLITGTVGVSVGWRIGTQHPELHANLLRPASSRVVFDTSFVMDPRCLAVLDAGLGAGLLLVPAGVTEELQNLAEIAGDDPRALRAKAGLKTLATMHSIYGNRLQVIDDPVHPREPVDSQVLRIARTYGAMVMTTDSNLASLASSGDLPACNPNALLEACQHPWQQGEIIKVKVEKRGRYPQQGIAHAADGTIIYIDDAANLLGKEVDVILRQIQMSAGGAQIFASLAPASS